MINELKIGNITISIVNDTLIRIDDPDNERMQSGTPAFFIEAASIMNLNGAPLVLKTKSNNFLLNGKRFRITDRDLKTGDFVVATTASKKGYGWLRYVTKMNHRGETSSLGINTQTFMDDGKISSQKPAPLCYSKNYHVIEFIDAITIPDEWNNNAAERFNARTVA